MAAHVVRHGQAGLAEAGENRIVATAGVDRVVAAKGDNAIRRFVK